MPWTVQVRNKGDFGWVNDQTYSDHNNDRAKERAVALRKHGYKVRIVKHAGKGPTMRDNENA